MFIKGKVVYGIIFAIYNNIKKVSATNLFLKSKNSHYLLHVLRNAFSDFYLLGKNKIHANTPLVVTEVITALIRQRANFISNFFPLSIINLN